MHEIFTEILKTYSEAMNKILDNFELTPSERKEARAIITNHLINEKENENEFTETRNQQNLHRTRTRRRTQTPSKTKTTANTYKPKPGTTKKANDLQRVSLTGRTNKTRGKHKP